MYELRIDFADVDDYFIEAYGDDIHYLEIEKFEDIMTKITDGIDVAPYIDLEFFKEFFGGLSWPVGNSTYENDEEAREDLRDLMSSQPWLIYKEFNNWEEYSENEMLYNILDAVGYEMSTVGYSDWTYAFYPKGKRKLAKDLWDGDNCFVFYLIDENGNVLEMNYSYEPGQITDDVIDDMLSTFFEDVDEVVITGDVAMYTNPTKYKVKQ